MIRSIADHCFNEIIRIILVVFLVGVILGFCTGRLFAVNVLSETKFDKQHCAIEIAVCPICGRWCTDSIRCVHVDAVQKKYMFNFEPTKDELIENLKRRIKELEELEGRK